MKVNLQFQLTFLESCNIYNFVKVIRVSMFSSFTYVSNFKCQFMLSIPYCTIEVNLYRIVRLLTNRRTDLISCSIWQLLSI